MARRTSSPSGSTPLRMADIAKLAGVSVATVSRALAGNPRVPATVQAHVRKIAKAHGYIVNPMARNLRKGRSHTVGVVIPLAHEAGQRISDPFFIELLGHLADALTERGNSLLLSKVTATQPGWLDQLIAQQRCDGIIVIGQSTQHDVLNATAQEYLPMVVWGGHLPGQLYCTVGTDNVGGARAAVDHLLRLGHQRIAFLGNPDVPEIGLRYQGYVSALAKAGLTVDPALVAPVHFTLEAAYHGVIELIETGVQFDAALAASDIIALAAVQALTAAGKSVPGDIAVIGYDDIALAAHANPPLTTVRQDLEAGARTMVDLLLRRIDGEAAPSATMPTQLVVRRSCGVSV
jgi:DNA-binding LacI/PurR family transcriptional regulator